MSVIFTRAPLRISLGGGGTDLPSYYREHGGFLVAGAIDKYVYMLTHTVFQRRYRMKYSRVRGGRRARGHQAPDPARDALRHWNGDPLEIASVADVPAGTGLGSSGAFTVVPAQGARAGASGWRSRRAARRGRRATSRSTSSASRSASRTSTSPAHGGICAYTFNRDGIGRRRAARARAGDARRDCATTSCSSTPARRAAASAILADQVKRTRERRRGDAREPPPHEGDRAREPRAARARATSRRYAELMHEHWHNKRERSPGMADRAHRRPLHARAPQRRASAASSSAPAAAASCSSTRRGPTTRARRWRRPARRSCASTSSSRVGAYATGARSEPALRRHRRLRADRAQARGGARPTTRSSAASTSTPAPRARCRRARRAARAARWTSCSRSSPTS